MLHARTRDARGLGAGRGQAAGLFGGDKVLEMITLLAGLRGFVVSVGIVGTGGRRGGGGQHLSRPLFNMVHGHFVLWCEEQEERLVEEWWWRGGGEVRKGHKPILILWQTCDLWMASDRL